MELLKASLIRQFVFCPRIFYFYNFCDITPKYPKHVDFGNNFHKKQDELFKSRTFAKLGLSEYKAYKNQYLEDEELCGVCDMLFVGVDEVVVLEFKQSDNLNLSNGAKMQLLAYAKMASKTYAKPCKRVILCSSNHLKHKVFNVFPNDFARLKRVVKDMKNLLDNGVFPNSSASLNACNQCEFFNYCDDRE